MPLSISNSRVSSPPPALAYFRIACLALLVAGLLFGTTEWRLRRRGMEIALEDSQMLWALHRDRVYTVNGRKKIVIIGSSRAHLGLVPEVFRKEFPSMDVVHLAITGVMPYVVLKDLAEDPKFDGWILCDTVGWRIRTRGDRQFVDYYRYYLKSPWNFPASLNAKLNVLIKVWMQSRLVVLAAHLNSVEILFPKSGPYYVSMDTERYRPAYFLSRLSPKELQAERATRVEQAQRLSKEINLNLVEQIGRKDLKQFNDLMQSKGGELFLVRMPSRDERWVADQKIYPKNIWDRLKDWSGAKTIHFKDDPVLSGFPCPDTSHLDASDAPAFSKRLSEIMKAQLAAE